MKKYLRDFCLGHCIEPKKFPQLLSMVGRLGTLSTAARHAFLAARLSAPVIGVVIGIVVLAAAHRSGSQVIDNSALLS